MLRRNVMLGGHNAMKHLSNHLVSLLLILLFCLVGGCVSEQAQSDWQWKQANPGWQSPTPQDPRPQWDVLGWPSNTQFL
jgi:hypothetical protein